MRLMLSLWLLAANLALAAEADRGELFLQRQRYANEALQLPLANGQMTVLKRPATTTAIKGHALLFADIGSDPERSPRIRTLRHRADPPECLTCRSTSRPGSPNTATC